MLFLAPKLPLPYLLYTCFLSPPPLISPPPRSFPSQLHKPAHQMGGTEAFPDLGSHCTLPSCRQLDFLPFQCDSCLQMFCLEHRSYHAHSCPKGDMKDTSVMICPVCASTVKKVFNEHPDITLGKHLQSNCDPDNYKRVMNKPKCPVKRCRETLTFSNSHVCKSCNLKTCLKHRFPLDHACKTAEQKIRTGMRKEAADLAADFTRVLSDRQGTECKSSTSVLGSKAGSASSRSLEAH